MVCRATAVDRRHRLELAPTWQQSASADLKLSSGRVAAADCGPPIILAPEGLEVFMPRTKRPGENL